MPVKDAFWAVSACSGGHLRHQELFIYSVRITKPAVVFALPQLIFTLPPTENSQQSFFESLTLTLALGFCAAVPCGAVVAWYTGLPRRRGATGKEHDNTHP